MGGGGPAKAADPKVTPFVDYSAQTPDIPNWFAGRQASGGSFAPDFSQSQQSFGQPAQQLTGGTPAVMSQAALGNTGIVALPQGQQVQPQNVAPTGPHIPHNMQQSGDFGMQHPPEHMMRGPNEDHLARMQRIRERRMRFGIPTRPMPYSNYTDTNPAMSTGPDGAPFLGPNSFFQRNQ